MRFFLKTCYGALITVVGCMSISFAAYQQQGFTTYTEASDNSVSFSCAGQCFLLIGPMGYYDLLSLKGTLQGDGQIGYGFLVGQQVFPGDLFPAQGMNQKTFAFSTHPVFSQLPSEGVQVVVLVNGNVEASGLSVALTQLSFGQKISQGRKDFWTNEPLRPYSINLRYGVKILGTPLVKIIYWVFALGFIWTLLFVRDKQKKQTFILSFAVILVVLFAARNLLNWTDWTSTTLTTYSSPAEDQKSFYDLGDYPVFIKKMRETLKLDDKFGKGECTIYFEATQDRPFKPHADMLYIKPCEVATDKITADYIVYYKKPLDSETANKPLLLEFNGSFLIQNN